MKENLKCKSDDQLILRKALDSAFFCRKSGITVYTDFYDPRNASIILDSLRSSPDIFTTCYGGSDNCERVMLSISPFCCDFCELDFPIKSIFIDSSRFSRQLTHRDFLGALLNLGIDRGKIGDILVKDGNAVVFAHNNISSFIVDSLCRVGNIAVTVSFCERPAISVQEGKIIKVTVPSMRADAIVGEAFRLSRSMAKELIVKEKLFINWKNIINPSHILKEGDVLSLRGYGRTTIRKEAGTTKKNRIFLELER